MEGETVNAGELKEFAVQFKDEIGLTFAGMQKQIDGLKAQIKALESGDKFQAQKRKVTESKTVSYKDLIKK
jgi:hypothetical protein